MKLRQLRTSELQGGPAGHSDDVGITHWFPDCFSRQILRASSLQPVKWMEDGGQRQPLLQTGKLRGVMCPAHGHAARVG